MRSARRRYAFTYKNGEIIEYLGIDDGQIDTRRRHFFQVQQVVQRGVNTLAPIHHARIEFE